MKSKEDEIYDIAMQEGKTVQECMMDIYNKGRADKTKEIKELYTEWQIETLGFYVADTETTRFLNKLGKYLGLLKEGAENG